MRTIISFDTWSIIINKVISYNESFKCTYFFFFSNLYNWKEYFFKIQFLLETFFFNVIWKFRILIYLIRWWSHGYKCGKFVTRFYQLVLFSFLNSQRIFVFDKVLFKKKKNHQKLHVYCIYNMKYLMYISCTFDLFKNKNCLFSNRFHGNHLYWKMSKI